MPIVLADHRDGVHMSVNSDGTFFGNSACNGFQGEYVSADHEFVVSQGVMEAMDCIDDDTMQVDRIVGRVLGSDETETTVNPELGTMTWTLEDATLMWSRSRASELPASSRRSPNLVA